MLISRQCTPLPHLLSNRQNLLRRRRPDEEPALHPPHRHLRRRNHPRLPPPHRPNKHDDGRSLSFKDTSLGELPRHRSWNFSYDPMDTSNLGYIPTEGHRQSQHNHHAHASPRQLPLRIQSLVKSRMGGLGYLARLHRHRHSTRHSARVGYYVLVCWTTECE